MSAAGLRTRGATHVRAAIACPWAAALAAGFVTVNELEVVDADTLRIVVTGGYGSRGESIRYIRDAAGEPQRVIAGGVSAYPVDAFRARYAER